MPLTEAQKRSCKNYRTNNPEYFRKSSLEFYHKNKEAINQKRKEKRDALKATSQIQNQETE